MRRRFEVQGWDDGMLVASARCLTRRGADLLAWRLARRWPCYTWQVRARWPR